ncbi:MAG: HEPN domain-containing protein [Prevotella sp.]|nr:HEPN domain-containing protein [Prevotella sp.]MBQ6208356.1 HEPN domain-containing protein [Prevotella sp.]
MNPGLTSENYAALSQYRQQRAHETLAEIPYLRDQGFYNTATNRLYYACYYAVIALLNKHKIPATTHAGVKTMLGLHFVSKGLISKESGRAFSNLYDSRQRGDYDEFVYSTREEVDELYPKAKRLLEEIDNLLK